MVFGQGVGTLGFNLARGRHREVEERVRALGKTDHHPHGGERGARVGGELGANRLDFGKVGQDGPPHVRVEVVRVALRSRFPKADDGKDDQRHERRVADAGLVVASSVCAAHFAVIG